MPSGQTRLYAPDNVAIVIGTQPVTGVKSGSFVEVDRAVDTAELDIGSDGEVTLIISPNQSGTMKLTVQQSAPINDYLNTLFQALQIKDMSNAVVAFTLNDKNGNTVCSAQQAVVKKPAKVTFADKTEGWEWTLLTGYLSIAPGSQAVIG